MSTVQDIAAASREIPFAQSGFQRSRAFLAPGEAEHWRQRVIAQQDHIQTVKVKARMNLKYHVMDGLRIRQHLPDLFELAAGRLREIVQDLVGEPIELLRDGKRALRIQHYRAKSEGFLWHFDGAMYSALLTFANSNRGATEIISPRLSRYLKPVPFVLFPFPSVLSLARPDKIVAEPGDLLVIQGGTAIHRGTSVLATGERMVFVASFDPVGRKTWSLRDAFARRLNF